MSIFENVNKALSESLKNKQSDRVLTLRAIVSAKNNIYVWGKLLGIASAGKDGNKKSSIASLYLNPLQLRISDIIAVGPKEKPKNQYPEVAVLENQSIVIKPYKISGWYKIYNLKYICQ